MKKSIHLLASLQRIHTEMEGIADRLRQMPERLREMDVLVDTAQSAMAQRKETLAQAQKDYRALEAETRSAMDGARKKQARLMEVKSNKEYQAILTEIEDNKEKIGRIEDDMIRLLDTIESLERDFQEQEKAFAVSKAETEKQKAAIASESRDLNNRIDTLEKEREALAGTIPKDMMQVFSSVQNRGIRPSIVPVVKCVCEGCNINIPAQLNNDLQLFDSLKFCPFCHRIIYWAKSEAAS